MESRMTQENNNGTNPLEYVSQQCSEAAESTKQLVEDNPISSTLVSFGAGFAIGLAITALVGQGESTQRTHFANKISSQVMNGLQSWLPNSSR